MVSVTLLPVDFIGGAPSPIHMVVSAVHVPAVFASILCGSPTVIYSCHFCIIIAESIGIHAWVVSLPVFVSEATFASFESEHEAITNVPAKAISSSRFINLFFLGGKRYKLPGQSAKNNE